MESEPSNNTAVIPRNTRDRKQDEGFRRQYPDGQRVHKSEYDIISEKVRAIHPPLIDLPPLKYEAKHLGRYRLYISNISTAVSKEDLESVFKQYGEVNDVFIQPNKNFGFIRMDYYHNALKAKRELHGSLLKDRKIFLTFSPHASILVKNLSTSVSNELLHTAFSIFGEIEYCFIITDKRGKSTGDGVVDYAKKGAAVVAKKVCSEQMFFVTSSLTPVIVEEYNPPTDCDGISEEMCRKNHNYYEERQLGPRFASADSFEYEYANRFKELWNRYQLRMEALKSEKDYEERQLEVDMMRARYDHETERLKDLIKQREKEKERLCHKLEPKNKHLATSEGSSMMAFNGPDTNLFTHANHLNSLLDNEEREIQKQWGTREFNSADEGYNQSRYQHYDDRSTTRRKVPEVIIHCQKRSRFE